MKADICKKNPARFEIGPMYSARVSFERTRLALWEGERGKRKLIRCVRRAAKGQEDVVEECFETSNS